MALAPFALLPFGSPMAQDAPQNTSPGNPQAGGLTASLRVGQRLDYENRSGVGTVTDEGISTITGLGFVLDSTTRSQSLRLSMGTGLRYQISHTEGGDRFDLDDPQLGLSYSIQSRAARLSFDGRYRRVDIEDAVFMQGPDSDDAALTGGGTRTTTRLGTKLELGRDAPFGAQLSYAVQTTRYGDTTDPSLVDLDTDSYAARLRFDISPRLQLSTFADISDRDAAGPGSSDRRAQDYGIGTAYQLTKRTKAQARLFHTRIDSDDNAGTTARITGTGGALELDHKLQNGGLSFDASLQETVNGAERQLIFGRDLAFKRGTLGLTLGVSKTDGLEAEPLVGLALGYDLDGLSRLNLALTRDTAVDDDNDTTLNTRLSLGYSRALSELSNLQATLSLIEREVQTAAGQDQRATQLSLSHSYALGRDLALVSGYSFDQSKRDGQPETERSRVFVGLERTFNWRP